MTIAKWGIIDAEAEKRKNIERLGQEEYNRRLAVVTQKKNDYPEEEWRSRIIFGGQFEVLAMAASEDVFAKLEKQTYKQWESIIHKIATT